MLEALLGAIATLLLIGFSTVGWYISKLDHKLDNLIETNAAQHLSMAERLARLETKLDP